jgi:hypothetical protein
VVQDDHRRSPSCPDAIAARHSCALADVGLGEVLAQIGPEIVVSPMATEYK